MRKANTESKRGKNGHRALATLCKRRNLKNADIAAALKIGVRHVIRLMNCPYRMNVWQIMTFAGLLSVSPEYLLYVIRFNNLKQNPPTVTTELTEFKVKFPV